jgi:hypothetical protein
MFSNGCIAVISEGEVSRLGSISLSLKGESSTSGPSQIIPGRPNESQIIPGRPNESQIIPGRPNESQIIPGRPNESPIADILAEALTTVTSGILMVSYFAEKELLGGDLKEMVDQLRNIISEKVK